MEPSSSSHLSAVWSVAAFRAAVVLGLCCPRQWRPLSGPLADLHHSFPRRRCCSSLCKLTSVALLNAALMPSPWRCRSSGDLHPRQEFQRSRCRCFGCTFHVSGCSCLVFNRNLYLTLLLDLLAMYWSNCLGGKRFFMLSHDANKQTGTQDRLAVFELQRRYRWKIKNQENNPDRLNWFVF